MKHIVYLTTNTINGKKYIGKHSTNSIDFDGYLGSGKALLASLEKYGKENFTRETLYSFNNEEEAFLKESELVTQDIVLDRNYYNLTLGGFGNPFSLNSNESIKKRTQTYIERGHATCEHMRTEDSLNKAKESRKSKGLDQCIHMNNPVTQELAVKNGTIARLNTYLNRYPYLRDTYRLISKDGNLMKEDSLYEIFVEVLGKSRAISLHLRLMKKIQYNKPLNNYGFKGCFIRK